MTIEKRFHLKSGIVMLKALKDGELAVIEKKDIAEELIEHATTYMVAIRYFSEKNYAAVYKMVEGHPYLLETEIVEKLESAWRKVVEKAEILAAKGDVVNLRKTLKPFFVYSHKNYRIVLFFKQAYIAQIEQLIREKNPNIKRAILNYIDIFGRDDEINALLVEIKYKDAPEKELVPCDSIDVNSLPDKLLGE